MSEICWNNNQSQLTCMVLSYMGCRFISASISRKPTQFLIKNHTRMYEIKYIGLNLIINNILKIFYVFQRWHWIHIYTIYLAAYYDLSVWAKRSFLFHFSFTFCGHDILVHIFWLDPTIASAFIASLIQK